MTPRDYQHKNMIQIFLYFFKPHMGLFILDMVCALIVALVDLAYPLVSRWAMYELHASVRCEEMIARMVRASILKEETTP